MGFSLLLAQQLRAASAALSAGLDDEPTRSMHLFAVRISITNGKGHVALADQVHEEASSCRVELTFPLAAEPEAGFADREEQIIRDARAVLAAALLACDRR